MNPILLFLLILWALLLFGGFLFGKETPEAKHKMPTWTRMGASLTLVIAAWLWWTQAQGDFAPLALLFAIGMTLGFTGDLFLARVLPAPNRVLAGMGMFGLGHIAYIAGILGFTEARGLTTPALRWGALALWLLIGAVGWYIIVYRADKPGLLHVVALPYSLLLASTVGFSMGLALHDSAFIPLAVGAALFLLSDLILATEIFRHARFRFLGDLVWLTYSPGQMLIVFTAVLSIVYQTVT